MATEAERIHEEHDALVSQSGSKSTKDAHDPANPRVFLDVTIGGIRTGRIIIELFKNVVPKTAENFRLLCSGERGYGYRGTRFFRVIPDFMCMGGDITRDNGTGGRSIYGDSFPDENFLVAHDAPGVVTMANQGPNNNNSQFIITTVKTDWLNGANVAFGIVTDGMDVLHKIEGQGSQSGEVSLQIIIEDCGQL